MIYRGISPKDFATAVFRMFRCIPFNRSVLVIPALFTLILIVVVSVHIQRQPWRHPGWTVDEAMVTTFKYPLKINIKDVVHQTLTNDKYDSGVTPINVIDKNFLIESETRCKGGGPLVLFVIKSKLDHFEHRNAIRETWGAEGLVKSTPITRVFLLGSKPSDTILHQRIMQEQQDHGDIIQGTFVDTYYNNTIKLLLGLHWASTRCAHASYVAFVDDDFFVAPHQITRMVQYMSLFNLQDFVIGYVLDISYPYRNPLNKWYISEEEYPYKVWPPYMIAGCFILPTRTARKFSIASQYIKFLRFDDVFLGIVALKLGVPLLNTVNIYPYRAKFPGMSRVSDTVLGAHDYKPQGLRKVWEEYLSELRMKMERESTIAGRRCER